MSCTCIGPRYAPYSKYNSRSSDTAAIDTNLNIFSHDANWIGNRTYHLPGAERMRYVLYYEREYLQGYEKIFVRRVK